MKKTLVIISLFLVFSYNIKSSDLSSCPGEKSRWYKKAAILGRSWERSFCLDKNRRRISWYDSKNSKYIASLDFHNIRHKFIKIYKQNNRTYLDIPLQNMERGRKNLVLYCKGSCLDEANKFRSGLLNLSRNLRKLYSLLGNKSHSFLIKKKSGVLYEMDRLGYSVSFEGTCYGIAGMAISAAMQSKVPEFVRMMESIKDHNGLAKTVHGIKLKRVFNDKDFFVSTKLNKMEINLLAFLDGINFYQGQADIPGFYLQSWKKVYSLLNLGKFFCTEDQAKSNSTYCKSGKSLRTSQGLGKFSRKEVKKLLSHLIDSRSDVAYLMTNPAHAIAVIKGDPGTALVVSHDTLSIVKDDVSGVRKVYESLWQSPLWHVEQVSLESYERPKNSKGEDLFLAVEMRLPEKDKGKALAFAVLNDHKNLANRLIKEGVSPFELISYETKNAEQDKISPFEVALEEGKFAQLKTMVALDSSKKYLSQPSRGTDWKGVKPLFLAAAQGNLKVFKYLESFGLEWKGFVQSKGKSYGASALFLASYDGNLGMVKYLVSKGAKPFVKMSVGKYKGKSSYDAAKDGESLNVINYFESLK